MDDQVRSASELNELGVACAKQRKLPEAAEYFRQAVAADRSSAVFHRNLGHALTELGDLPGAMAAYEQSIRLDPQSVETFNNLGILQSRQGDYARAIATLSRATNVNPNYAPAYSNLAVALALSYQNELAIAAFQRAVELAPDYAEAHSGLGMALVQAGRPDDSLASFERSLALKPEYAAAYCNLGIALTDLGRLDDALVTYQKALDLDPGYDEVRMNRSATMFLQGDYVSGWREYEFRLRKSTNVRVTHDAPRWHGEPLGGRTLLLEAEQGMGDTIQFVRYAAEIKRQKGGRIMLAVERSLVPLLTGVAGVDVLLPQASTRPAFDVWSPLLSVPGLLNVTPSHPAVEVPYLQADTERMRKWAARLGKFRGLKIGIAWQGNKFNKVDYRRSFPLASFASLAKLHGLSLISLQKGEGTEQLDNLTALDIVSLGPEFDASGGAFLDSAAVMKSLDLVITADTSLGHLAGALGVPVWLPLGFVSDWRWGISGERTPWYPTMRLFRQEKLRDWAGVFARMAEALQTEFPALRLKRPEEYQLATSGFNRLARTRHGPLIYNRHDTYIGKSLAELGEFSEGEIDFFQHSVRPGATVVEAGANIGAHTVKLARLAGEAGLVHAIEPQRIVFQTLAANVALNSLTNVHCHQAAVGDKPGWAVVPTMDYGQPNNFGGLAIGSGSEGKRVPVITIDSLQLSRCDLIKIDVEGMELAAIHGAAETIRQYRPILYVENDREEKSPPLIEALFALGYKLYWHLPRYYTPGNYYGNKHNSFGNLASVNMICVHSSIATNIQGLAPITSRESDWRRP
jgi:FkbM family methyltransferase